MDVGRPSQSFGGRYLDEVRRHLVRSPDLGRGEAAQDAGDLHLLTGRHHVWCGNRSCNEIGAEDTGFAGLSRAGYGSYANEESALLEFLDRLPCTSDGGVGQFHSSYA